MDSSHCRFGSCGIDRVGRHHLAGRIDDRDLHAGAVARIEAERRARAGGSGEQQVAQVAGKYLHRLVFGELPEPHLHIEFDGEAQLRPPRPAHGVEQPLVARATLVGDAEGERDTALVAADIAGLGGVLVLLHAQIEDLLLLAAEEREDAVGGQFRQRLGEIEIVGELRAVGLLAVAHLGGEAATLPIDVAQRAEQFGILGKTFDQDGAGALERRLRRRNLLLRHSRKPPQPPSGRGSGSFRSRSASGSRPASLAICALVRRFGL